MKIKLSAVGIFSLFLLSMLIFNGLYAQEQHFVDQKEEAAFHRLLKEFRCVTCPNQSIADSKAPIAEAMQDEIYRRFKKGESIAEIKGFLQENYGDYVLYRPTLKKQNALLWFGPFLFLSLGLIGWLKWRR